MDVTAVGRKISLRVTDGQADRRNDAFRDGKGQRCGSLTQQRGAAVGLAGDRHRHGSRAGILSSPINGRHPGDTAGRGAAGNCRGCRSADSGDRVGKCGVITGQFQRVGRTQCTIGTGDHTAALDLVKRKGGRCRAVDCAPGVDTSGDRHAEASISIVIVLERQRSGSFPGTAAIHEESGRDTQGCGAVDGQCQVTGIVAVPIRFQSPADGRGIVHNGLCSRRPGEFQAHNAAVFICA